MIRLNFEQMEALKILNENVSSNLEPQTFAELLDNEYVDVIFLERNKETGLSFFEIEVLTGKVSEVEVENNTIIQSFKCYIEN